MTRVLVAGIGNVFLGDDGFGVEVLRHLAARPARPGVVLMDAGIRGLDLTYALLDDYDAAILVDAAPRGRAPGTLYVLEPKVTSVEEPSLFDAHAMDPVRVLALSRALGGRVHTVRVVGCEPAAFGTPEEPEFALSPAVQAAVVPAVGLVDELLDGWLDGAPARASEPGHA
jgi:hydrogenase maturation protease